MKRMILLLTFVCLMIPMLSGCNIDKKDINICFLTKKNKIGYNSENGFFLQERTWYSSDVFRAILAGDEDAVYSFFCDRVKNDKNTRNEIKAIIGVLKGNVKSWDECGGLDRGQFAKTDGEITVDEREYEMFWIRTYTGETYDVRIIYYEVNAEEPDLVGMTCLQLFKYDLNKYVDSCHSSPDGWPAFPRYQAGTPYGTL